MRSHRPVVNESAFDPDAERNRLVALCHRWTGDSLIAEDIAQETILIALRKQQQSVTPREWQPYLVGIARKLCANHLRTRQRQEIQLDDLAFSPSAELVTSSDDDPLNSLLHNERSALIDHALTHLKGPMRDLLIERYVEDMPLAEIAAERKLTENAAAVRIHRGRQALERVLTTLLREEANAHGILPTDAATGWRETAIYCPRCASARLEGRFVKENGLPEFALRCPRCPRQLVGMTSQAAPLPASEVLSTVSGFRAGLNRVNRWWQQYVESSLSEGVTNCIECGRKCRVSIVDKPGGGFGTFCDACAKTTFYITATGLLFHDEEFHRFWRRYPRMHNRGEKSIVCEGRPATMATFADPAGNAFVRVIYDQATLRKMVVETSG